MKLTRLQELAGIKLLNEELQLPPNQSPTGESIGGGDIHILNNNNAQVKQKPFEGGGTISYLEVNLSQDLSATDIGVLITELKLFQDKLEKINDAQK